MNSKSTPSPRVLAILLLLVAWGPPAPATAPDSASRGESTHRAFTATTFASGLQSAWGMEFMPDGRLLVTERAGRLRIIGADGGQISAPVLGLPAVDHRDHGGLLDITIDRAFARNRRVYFSYTEAGRGKRAHLNGVTVARARLSDDGSRLQQVRVLFRQTPRVASGENLGGRLAVSADGHLFITLGDRREAAQRVRAQDLGYLQGKTARIRTDGSVPADNPFVGIRGARREIWSLGHRNPQGAFVHPETGALWIAEHGPFGGDEVNLVRPGGNYGWPVVTFGCEYDSCAPIGEGTHKPGMQAPLTHWGATSIAPSNLILYTGALWPEWKGSVLVGALRGRGVWRLVLSGKGAASEVVGREALFPDLGERVRDLRQGPDGALYLLTDGDEGRVIRMAR